jgi:hypothetical protein
MRQCFINKRMTRRLVDDIQNMLVVYALLAKTLYQPAPGALGSHTGALQVKI